MIKSPDNLAIIGRIPGYNQNIDTNETFASELLKGLTFIDLIPNSYKLSNINLGDLSKTFTNLEQVIKSPGLFEQDSATMTKIFSGILERMEKDFSLSPDFTRDIKGLRLIAANDSTFTETFSNSFGDDNSLIDMAKSAINSTVSSSKLLSGLSKYHDTFSKGLKGLSYSDMINLAGKAAVEGNNLTNGSALGEILAGATFGMNMATPKQWNGSDYTSTLTVFIKLVAPVGTPECIRRNILEPIFYLLAASSPLTYGGSMYGFPLLWNVQAHGVTNFKVGAIANLSLIRGSFETTFNYLLQPTVVDVRLALVPLVNDFAVQTNDLADSKNHIYLEENARYVGVQNPSDIKRGVTNTRSGGTQEQILTIKL